MHVDGRLQAAPSAPVEDGRRPRVGRERPHVPVRRILVELRVPDRHVHLGAGGVPLPVERHGRVWNLVVLELGALGPAGPLVLDVHRAAERVELHDGPRIGVDSDLARRHLPAAAAAYARRPPHHVVQKLAFHGPRALAKRPLPAVRSAAARGARHGHPVGAGKRRAEDRLRRRWGAEHAKVHARAGGARGGVGGHRRPNVRKVRVPRPVASLYHAERLPVHRNGRLAGRPADAARIRIAHDDLDDHSAGERAAERLVVGRDAHVRLGMRGLQGRRSR